MSNIDFGAMITAEAKAAQIRESRMAGVIAERARRLAAGFDYDFGDDRGIHHIGTSDADLAGWTEVTQLSSAAIALGAGETSIQIVTDTGPVTVSAIEWQQILLAAAAFRQPIWAASFVIQSAEEIPEDVQDSVFWP